MAQREVVINGMKVCADVPDSFFEERSDEE